MGSLGKEDTLTGAPADPQARIAESKVWTLRAVFVPEQGIVEADALTVRGPVPTTIGRYASKVAPARRLLLADQRVSREHAQVVVESNRAFIKDLGSKNGTYLNRRPIQPSKPWPLADGDVISLGGSCLVVRHEPETVPDVQLSGLLGVSHASRKLRHAVARCALSDGGVLLLGDTGTGKGAAAATIHALSGKPGNLVPVNCAAVPVTLAEGMFFGVQKGAYTGAVDRAGYLGQAHDGTLFLDEVGDLPLDIQAKLLHLLETKQVAALGSARSIRYSVRIIAATNRDLRAALESGSFRADLYQRLAEVVIRLPPLCERREDILILAAQLGGASFRPSAALALALLLHPFPGNVRELKNLTRLADTLGEAELMTELEVHRASPAALVPPLSAEVPPVSGPSDRPPLSRADVVWLLKHYRGSLRSIENELGYSSRTFRRWIALYDLASFREEQKPNID